MSDWIVSGILGFSLTAMYLLGWLSCELFNKRREVKQIMATLDEILAVVTTIPTKADSIIAILDGIKQQLADALAQIGGVTPEMQAKIDEIFATAKAGADKIQTAIDANTPIT